MRTRPRLAGLSLLLSLGGCAHGPAVGRSPGSLQKDVTFTEYSPLSSGAEIARRILTPLASWYLQQSLSAKGKALREQPVNLAQEKFAVYVPAGVPPKGGYGLLVFVAPWPEPTEPKQWRPPLDRHGLIFVAAANSGNESNMLDRRVPLALLGYENIRARYPLDPKRVYVGGLSGGSRVAEMTALGYPDVFRGALLNAGSEPIGGERGIYLPPANLFQKFQESSLVYVTGDHDEDRLQEDRVSRASMRDWCVFNLQVTAAPRLAHEALDAVSLDRALDALERPSAVDAEKAARCNAKIQGELSSKLADAEAAIARGDRDGARGKIIAIDGHYGGLAAPATVELYAKLSAHE